MYESNNGGFLDRLKQNETLRKITGGRPEIAIFGLPVLVIAIIAIAAVAVVSAGGDGDDSEATAPTATRTVAAVPSATPTPGANAGQKTPIAFSAGDFLTAADLAARGVGEPGRGPFTGSRLVIPKIDLNAEFSIKSVGTDGQMPNPNGPEDVAWYDFSQWPGLGGLPLAGGNVVLAGHVDYINYGPAVFWRLDELQPGDEVTIEMADGSSATYRIEFNKHIEVGDADWTGIVQATEDESITLITCSGEFEAGHYTNRQIVWGRRV
jgi:LPXTG-site transpeptidase (sortase) family protein